jgi:alanyl-tRNA synthetase
MAGVRVLNDYRKANRTATEVAALFSAGRDDTPALLDRLIEENKRLTRRVRELDQIACRVEAAELLKEAGAGSAPDRIIITRVFTDRDADSLKHLALALMAHSRVIALLGSNDSDTARLVFARSADAAGDMNVAMRKACEEIDGRGGGKADLAQGGGKNVAALEQALQAARQLVS